MTNDYDMPICKQHQKELLHEPRKCEITVGVCLALSFLMGFLFCKLFEGVFP